MVFFGWFCVLSEDREKKNVLGQSPKLFCGFNNEKGNM